MRLLVLACAVFSFACASSDNPYNKKWREMGLSGAMVKPSRVIFQIEPSNDGGYTLNCNKQCREVFRPE